MVFSVNNYWYILKGYDESFALICQCISTLPNLCVDEEEKSSQSKTKPHANELSDGKAKPVRHGYVRKPFLYSKYFSDSDDERTVEQRRQSIVSAPLALLVCWPQNFSEQEFHFWFGDGSVFSFFSLLGLFFFLYYSCSFFRFPLVWHDLLSSTAVGSAGCTLKASVKAITEFSISFPSSQNTVTIWIKKVAHIYLQPAFSGIFSRSGLCWVPQATSLPQLFTNVVLADHEISSF